jgi:hypothetical protein
MITDTILELQSISSVLAGSIFVVLDNLLQRLRHDLSSGEQEWRSAGPLFGKFSFGQVVAASAANFRHCDEWAGVDVPTKIQLASIEIIVDLLNRPLPRSRGAPTIHTNVCDEMLLKVSKERIDELHDVTFQFTKMLAKFP